MRLRIVERKVLKEQTQHINKSIKPSEFLMLTTFPTVYSAINKLVESGKYNDLIALKKNKDRINAINDFCKIAGEYSDNASELIYRALKFIQPPEDTAAGYGQYDESKEGIISLTVKNGKVVEHGGRARMLYRWIKTDNSPATVQIILDDASTELPQELKGQESSSVSISTSNFGDAKSDESGVKKYASVEIALENILRQIYGSGMKERAAKFNSEHQITVSGEKAILDFEQRPGGMIRQLTLYKVSDKSVIPDSSGPVVIK